MSSKKIKLDHPRAKTSITSFFKSSSSNQTIVENSPSEYSFNELNVEPENKKKRKFVQKWLVLYSWLRYSDENDFMWCDLCTNANKKNGLNNLSENRNFQNTTLTRHSQLSEHKLLVEAPLHQGNLQRLQDKQDSEKDKALKVLLKCFHWMCEENLPISKFKSMIDLLHDIECPAISILKHIPFGYTSEFTAGEILDSLALVAETELNDQLSRSPYVTVLIDESTDVSNTKRLVIYGQLVINMHPTTVYINNMEIQDTTGKGIAEAVMQELLDRGVPPQKVMSLGSDGASVMTGKKNGVAAIMRRSNPHMTNVHCVAHRLALCTSQAAADIPLLNKHQQILTDLFYYFKGSSKRESRLHEIQSILEDPCLTIKEIHSVRWLSYFNALTTVFRTLDSLYTYLEELHQTGKDPKASGLKKKMATDTFIGSTYMMMDAMGPVTILSQFLQTENIDIALVKVKLDLCLQDLELVKSMESPYCRQLKDDLKDDTFRNQHKVSITNFNLPNLTSTFIDALTTNIKSSSPEHEVLKITRPAAVYWNGGVAHAFKGFAMTIGVIGTAAGIGTFYWLVIKKKRDIDKLQAAYWNPEAQKKKFDNMNKMKVFTCTQLDKYEWE